MGKLHDKVVFITGGASGIGKASAIWLASDDASFVTGSAILVDGGYTAQ